MPLAVGALHLGYRCLISPQHKEDQEQDPDSTQNEGDDQPRLAPPRPLDPNDTHESLVATMQTLDVQMLVVTAQVHKDLFV